MVASEKGVFAKDWKRTTGGDQEGVCVREGREFALEAAGFLVAPCFFCLRTKRALQTQHCWRAVGFSALHASHFFLEERAREMDE